MMGVSAPDASGFFEGYASLFGVPDLSHDVVMPGAFKQSLATSGTGGVKLLWQHDPAQPVGLWTSLEEDKRGLRCQGQLNLDVQRGREIYALLRQGAVDGLSIGFKTVRSRKDAAHGGRQLLAIELWEISVVTFPLLPEARISVVKARPDPLSLLPASEALLDRARKIFNAPNR